MPGGHDTPMLRGAIAEAIPPLILRMIELHFAWKAIRTRGSIRTLKRIDN